MIDRYLITLPRGLNLYPIPKSYNQTRLELEFQFTRNPYTKQTLITMENIKLSSTIRPVHRHESIGNPYVFLHDHRQTTFHSHRQPPALVIGMNPSPLLDLAIFCRFLIGTNPHRQLSCQLVTTFLPADLRLINSRYASKDTCPKTVSTLPS